MGFRDKMMDNMMGKMTSEEKKEMMDHMMDGFFSTMTDKEKQEMMNSMMPKMMEQMMGSGNSAAEGNSMMNMMGSMMGNSPMMGMMGQMMGSQGDNNSNPMDMCKEMMKNMSRTNDIATFATPEVRQLFEDWVQQVEEEIICIIKNDSTSTPDSIAEQLKISKNSALYFLTRLAQKDKINLNVCK